MELPKSYCTFVSSLPEENAHVIYHDTAYGFPTKEDDLFGRLVLEINQAGLSWTTILQKQHGFAAAYSHFNVRAVAAYGPDEVARLLGDHGIIRNKMKIEAAIQNAKKILLLSEAFGSFTGWLDAHHPLSRAEWVQLFKKTFQFTGGEITNEFLMSTGYLPGAHQPSCPIFNKIASLAPPWARAAKI